MLKLVDRGLWISSMPNLRMLKQCEADAVVCCVKKGSPLDVQQAVARYSCHHIPDGKHFREDLFRAAVDDVERWREQGFNVLVHCHAGRNRSATVAALYLMRRGWTAMDVIQHIRRIRPRAIGNPVFEAFLMKGYPL